jgi:hypothetical protein
MVTNGPRTISFSAMTSAWCVASATPGEACALLASRATAAKDKANCLSHAIRCANRTWRLGLDEWNLKTVRLERHFSQFGV